MKAKTITLVAAGLLVAVGGATGLAVANQSNRPSVMSIDPAAVATGFPTNAAGQTFGKLPPEVLTAGGPDLILVVMSDGRSGYVKKTDLVAAEGGIPSSPAEAVKQTEARKAAGPVTLTVFADDGTTVLGTWLANT